MSRRCFRNADGVIGLGGWAGLACVGTGATKKTPTYVGFLGIVESYWPSYGLRWPSGCVCVCVCCGGFLFYVGFNGNLKEIHHFWAPTITGKMHPVIRVPFRRFVSNGSRTPPNLS